MAGATTSRRPAYQAEPGVNNISTAVSYPLKIVWGQETEAEILFTLELFFGVGCWQESILAQPRETANGLPADARGTVHLGPASKFSTT